MSQIIIGMSGRAGAGKSTAANFLVEHARYLFDYSADTGVFSMAGKLKEICTDVLGLTPKQVYGTAEQKATLTRYRWEDLPHYEDICLGVAEKILWESGERVGICNISDPFWGELPTLQDVLGNEKINREFWQRIPSGMMTARQVMQEVGSGIFRRMWGDVWAEACIRSIRQSGKTVGLVDDCRFPNEVEAIQRAGGKVIRLTRAPFQEDEHESEKALDPERFGWKGFDAVVANNQLDIEQTHRLLLLALVDLGLTSRERVTTIFPKQ